MIDYVKRVVIFPRFTGLVCTTSVFTPPMDVRAFRSVKLVGWQGTGLGVTPATVEFTVQGSMDVENWTDIGTLSFAGPDEEATVGVNFEYPWSRVKAEISGTNKGITFWLLGAFVFRDGPGVRGEA